MALLKDSKGKRDHVFGLFSPSRNYYFQANGPDDTSSWVELIKQEARIHHEEQLVLYHSPTTLEAEIDQQRAYDRGSSSSPEPDDNVPRTSTTRDGIMIPSLHRLSTHDFDYSGNEQGLYSDFSDASSAPNTYSQSNIGSLIGGPAEGWGGAARAKTPSASSGTATSSASNLTAASGNGNASGPSCAPRI